MKGSFLRGLSTSLTLHSFSVTLFALDSRLFLIQLQINTHKTGRNNFKKGNQSSKQHADDWDAHNKAWAHMVLHLPHAEGGFGVTFNDVTKDAVFYTTTSRFVVWLGAFSQERQELWLPNDDLRDSSSWSSPPLLLLRDIHSKLLTQYDCKEVCAPSLSQINIGASGGLRSQDGVSQQ
jgi:hypothetical protein